MAVSAAPNSAISMTGSNPPSPGRIMIRTPTKPTTVAVQRRHRTFSPRNSTATTMTNSGVVNEIEVTAARVRWVRA